MAAKSKLYSFDGQLVPFTQLAARFTGYGPSALRGYLDAGAASPEDLVRMDREAQARRMAAARKNGRSRAFVAGYTGFALKRH